jgi:hypothetical protein
MDQSRASFLAFAVLSTFGCVGGRVELDNHPGPAEDSGGDATVVHGVAISGAGPSRVQRLLRLAFEEKDLCGFRFSAVQKSLMRSRPRATSTARRKFVRGQVD